MNVAFGLVREADTSQETLPPESFDYCVSIGLDGNYDVMKNGLIITQVEQQATNGDGIELVLGEGVLIFLITPEAGGVTELCKVNWEFDAYYHLAFSLNGAEGQQIQQVLFTPSPYTLTDNVGTTFSNTISTHYNLFQMGARARRTTISMYLNHGLGELLGFSVLDFTSAKARDSFLADESLAQAIIPNSVALEIPTLTMESYDGDGEFQKRRPVLSYIPALQTTNYNLTYHTSTPFLIDLNNAFPFHLNTIKVRLLEPSTREVLPVEMATLVFVVG